MEDALRGRRRQLDVDAPLHALRTTTEDTDHRQSCLREEYRVCASRAALWRRRREGGVGGERSRLVTVAIDGECSLELGVIHLSNFPTRQCSTARPCELRDRVMSHTRSANVQRASIPGVVENNCVPSNHKWQIANKASVGRSKLENTQHSVPSAEDRGAGFYRVFLYVT